MDVENTEICSTTLLLMLESKINLKINLFKTNKTYIIKIPLTASISGYGGSIHIQ